MPVEQVLRELGELGVQGSLPAVKELLETSERVKFGGLNLSATEADHLISLAAEAVEGLDSFGSQD